MTLGKQIKQARESMNLSQEELAEKLGVSRQAVSKWENDTSVPQGINREVLCQVLGLEMLSPEMESAVGKKKNWIAKLGWIIALALAIVLVIILSIEVVQRNRNGNWRKLQSWEGSEKAVDDTEDIVYKPLETELSSGKAETPAIKSIKFYDSEQNEVKEEALWYDMAKVESILVQWEGGTPDNIKMFSTPSGSETMEMTELLLTKSVPDGDTAVLLNVSSLKERLKEAFQEHVFFELDFGGTVVASDIYSVFYYVEGE